MRVVVDGALHDGVTAKDIILAIIGADRHGGRHRPCHRILRPGDRGAVDGRPHDGLQHVDRGRRARRHGRARREDLRLSEGSPEVAEGRAVGSGARLLGYAAHRRGRAFRRDVRLDAANLPPIVSWGTSPQDVVSIGGIVPRVEDGATEAEARLDQARARIYGPARRREDRRYRDRPRVHRLLHQRPHRGFARGGEDRRRAARSRAASTRWSCRAPGW